LQRSVRAIAVDQSRFERSMRAFRHANFPFAIERVGFYYPVEGKFGSLLTEPGSTGRMLSGLHAARESRKTAQWRTGDPVGKDTAHLRSHY